jgi:malate dehydrogenase (oxaloacetate-decarboxylating)(NADP+)
MLMLEQGDAASIISGVTVHYPDTIKPALEIIKVREGVSVISSFFLVIQKDKRFIFADPTINIDPTAEELAEIAINCAKASRFFEMDPKIAMLSFSNFGSVNHPQAKKMARAAMLVSKIDPTLKVDGEMQLDTAISEELINEFYPFSNIKGGANILIFPDLQSANISYKLIEQLGSAELVGPLLMGLKQPVNVLPRGCTVASIVNIAAITALQLEHGTF